jgi:putative PIN family toxin of toxin-antitoxin system
VRIVLDTGIYISALITKGTPPDRLYQSWDEGAFHLVTSSEQIAELSRVVGYKKLRKFITLDEAHVLIDNLHNRAEIVSNLPDVHLSPDPDDDLILATAIAGKADYIISGDKRDMLSLKEVQGIPIITARQAVEKLLD